MWYGGGVKQRGFEKVSDARLSAMNNHIQNLWIEEDFEALIDLRTFALSCEFTGLRLHYDKDMIPCGVSKGSQYVS